jgi:hypothetical protein
MDDNFDEPIKEQEPINEPKKNGDNTAWYFFLFLAFLTFLGWLFSHFKWGETRKRTRTPSKIQKEDVRKMYDVDKHTLGKWVKYFCDPSVLSYETYKKRRRLTGEEYFYLSSCLGLPTKEMPVRLKGEIADVADSDTDTLRTWVMQNIDKFDFPIEAYDALNVFPPLIAHQILEAFDRTFVYAISYQNGRDDT